MGLHQTSGVLEAIRCTILLKTVKGKKVRTKDLADLVKPYGLLS
jgi:hypothetical protein